MKTQRLTVWRETYPANDFEVSDPVQEKVAHPLATLEPRGGTETETANQQQGRTDYTIRMKWGASLASMDSSYWATWQNPATNREVRFNFTSVINVGEANQQFEIQAVRV